VTVVVVVPGQAEPWKVSNQAFRMLCRTADNQSWGDPQVTRVLTQAAALNGLPLISWKCLSSTA